MRPFTDPGTNPVIDTVGDHRPAVVFPGMHDVDFIAALGAVFMGPDLPGFRVQSQALHIAVSQSIDFRHGMIDTYKRIVFRHTAIFVYADQGTQVIVKSLRWLFRSFCGTGATIAERYEQCTIRREDQP